MGRETPVTAVCPQAIELCADTPDPDDALYWILAENPGDRAARDWEWIGQVCRAAADAGPQVLPALSLEEFRRLPLPAGTVRVQPPNGRTLVNLPTNVYVKAGQVVLPTTLLGFPVRVRATPVRYRWTFGDGATLTTTDPGGPYPDLRTAHTYRAAGERVVRLTTDYAGEYSVAGGPWLAVQGEAGVTSPGVQLTVLEARAQLVGDP